METEEIKATVQEILNRPLLQKIKDMLAGVNTLINWIHSDEEHSTPYENARLQGELYALTLTKANLELIIKFEEQKYSSNSSNDCGRISR